MPTGICAETCEKRVEIMWLCPFAAKNSKLLDSSYEENLETVKYILLYNNNGESVWIFWAEIQTLLPCQSSIIFEDILQFDSSCKHADVNNLQIFWRYGHLVNMSHNYWTVLMYTRKSVIKELQWRRLHPTEHSDQLGDWWYCGCQCEIMWKIIVAQPL